MKYALGNMLNGAGGLNADGLALDLQFAADKTLTARKGPTPVFTRASTATFVGSDGLIQSAAVNAARFDHDPGTLVCKGLLIEESRTNSWNASEGIGVSPWALTSTTTLNSDNTASPDGSATAEKFTVGSTTQEYGFSRNTFSFVSGTAYSISFFFKADQITRINIIPNNTLLLPMNAIFDLTGSGSIIGTPTGTASIQQFPGGWYRCSVSATALLSGITSVRVAAVSGTSISYPGNSVDSFWAWGAQLEAGSFPTSYIPTTTTSVIRSADVCSITGSDFSGFWNNSEGSLFASGISRGNLVMASSGTNANQIAIFRNASPLYMRFDVASGGTYTAQIIGATIADGSFNKTAGSYASNDARAAFNGTLGTPDVTVLIPLTLTTLNIGTGSAGGSPHNGTISAIRYYRKRLDNAKLQALTV